MKKVGFLLGFGLLPVWVATIAMFLGSLQSSRSSDYWAAAPWLVIFSIPFCGATLLIAAATLVRQASASGDRVQKNKAARSLFWSLVLLACVIVGVWWVRHEYRQRGLKVEEGLALEFVRNHDAVIQGGSRDPSPSLVATTKTNAGVPVTYEIGTPLGYAIVSVNESSGRRQFNLDCITTISLGGRDPTRSPCSQGVVSTGTPNGINRANQSINSAAAR
jgi:hypothetical protein